MNAEEILHVIPDEGLGKMVKGKFNFVLFVLTACSVFFLSFFQWIYNFDISVKIILKWNLVSDFSLQLILQKAIVVCNDTVMD